jgi:hypothetical protein
MEKITVIIEADGQVRVETKGFKGQGCMAASKFLEETLGAALEVKKTGEYYETEAKETVRIKSNGN